jgi:hypothetical protein
MRLNSRTLGTVLLCGGLLLVLAQGLKRTPEIRLWLFPATITEEKLYHAQRENAKIAEKLVAASVSVDALYKLSRPDEAQAAAPRISAFSLAWFKTIFLPDFLNSDYEVKWKKQLSQARTNLALLERRLRYLDAFLDSLSASSKADQATMLTSPNPDTFQQRIYYMKQRCRGYWKELDELSTELKNIQGLGSSSGRLWRSKETLRPLRSVGLGGGLGPGA